MPPLVGATWPILTTMSCADTEPAKILVVGDTPNDVECALVAGATPIGVATGGYSAADLRASGADIVFEDLSNTQAFLDLLK